MSLKPSKRHIWKSCWRLSQSRDSDLDTDKQEPRTVPTAYGFLALTVLGYVRREKEKREREGRGTHKSTLCTCPASALETESQGTTPWANPVAAPAYLRPP